ncbi:MAG: hypothetical protein GXO25_03465, partial [Euryarchaeota archaeon]|nr:hypothetical protein [Euryarchaeota archaeon]
MNKAKFILVTVVILLIDGAFFIMINAGTGHAPGPVPGSVMKSVEPIKIDNNTDFATQAAANNWSGNGTADNPYIIANYTIDATGYDY